MKKLITLLVTLVVLGSLVLIPTVASATTCPSCPCYIPTLTDQVNIGDPVSEVGHSLLGWGPIEPATHDGGWGGFGPIGIGTGENCRAAWSPVEGGTPQPWASFKLQVPSHEKAAYIELRVLDGQADDSFKVCVNNKLKYTYVGNLGSEDWVVHHIDVAGMTGSLTVKIQATAAAWTYWDPYGQLGVDWAKLYYAKHSPLQLTDAYLSSPSVKYVWGPGSLDSKVDLMYGGVGFALSGLTDKGTGIGDDWWATPPPGPDALSGLAENPSHPGAYTDATGYSCIHLCFTNLGTHDVNVCIYMNTGFTQGGWSADTGHGDDMLLDTFWQSDWTKVPAGKVKEVVLCFSNATAYNIADDPVHTGLIDGNKYAIFRLGEVTNLGFQVAGGVDPTSTWLVVGSPKWSCYK